MAWSSLRFFQTCFSCMPVISIYEKNNGGIVQRRDASLTYKQFLLNNVLKFFQLRSVWEAS